MRVRVRFITLGYAVPAGLSSVFLVEAKATAAVLSVAVFTLGQLTAMRSPRWGLVSGAGFLVGWSLGTGVTALSAILAAALVTGVSHARLDDNLLHVAVAMGGAGGGVASGAIVGLTQLFGGRRLRARSWIGANVAGGALAGAVFALSFAVAGGAAAATCGLLGCAAGIAWGWLAAGALPGG